MDGPKVGEHDEFEGIYTEKFRGLARPYGEFVKYERDRAAIDIGLHLTEPTNRRFRTVANSRVWFQLKGIHESTLPLSVFSAARDVYLDLEIGDLRFWYASPEAVYLAVYVECADLFLAEDVNDLVDRQWGEGIFDPRTFRAGQKKARVLIPADARLDDAMWRRMLGHRSMRIDGPSFRGRPLGHRLDPLRCILNKMEPSTFSELIRRLLAAHGYKVEEALDASGLFPKGAAGGDEVSLTLGTMHYTYEWVQQMMTEFGVGPGSEFRIEGQINHVQGPCAVLVHSRKASYPEAVRELASHLANDKNVGRLLVFVNEQEDPAYFGSFFGGVRGTGLESMPQSLGDLAFNVLTATMVYLEFRDRLSWRLVNYLY
ncbi:MAG: hypothetical protein M3416_02600 [Acidobacteriota bacterium]|nr:hypothetical protein [Acidobacteriota bacterium]